jgi:hypothetical protein
MRSSAWLAPVYLLSRKNRKAPALMRLMIERVGVYIDGYNLDSGYVTMVR